MQPSTAPLVTAASQPLARLVRDLCAVGDLRRHASRVGALIQRVTLRIEPLLPALAFRRDGYARTRVWRDDGFELLLLTWAAGAAAPVHDHDGQDCWFVPLTGAFDLDDYALLDDEPAVATQAGRARLTFLRSRRHGPGDVDRRDAYDSVHAVRAATPQAISLHVYARPIERCRVFDLERGSWQRRRIRCDAEALFIAGG
ncbi:MAG: hypothetical protein JWN44_6786 [Myxococcales bacterium]|nr:hypothetical protein [Myxococcales bacterium]